MKPAKKKETGGEIQIVELNAGNFAVCVLGVTPFICNRVSEKARRELLLPPGKRLTAADRAATLKHNPPEEYRNSPYRASGDDVPTRILVPSTTFKAAMRSAALDMEGGVSKAEIGRLTFVHGQSRRDYIDFYGIPQLFMSITRNQDMNRTPDVRTRAIVPAWACTINVTYIKPKLREKSVITLLAAAGLIRGVGDWRPERGSGDYGQFKIVAPDDPEFLEIVKTGGRAAQDAAFTTPQCYDEDSADLLSWWIEETTRKGIKIPAPASPDSVPPLEA